MLSIEAHDPIQETHLVEGHGHELILRWFNTAYVHRCLDA